MQQQQVQLRYFTVTAPTAGIVGDVPVRVGNQVSPQTDADDDRSERDARAVRARADRARGRAAERAADPDPRATTAQRDLATTVVDFISPRVDDQTQSVLVKAQVRNPDGRLRASQYVRARIIWKTAEGLVVPVTAVLRISGQFFAFVAEDAGGKLVAKQRAIKVGPIAGNNYPVLDGIKAGRARRRRPARRSSPTARRSRRRADARPARHSRRSAPKQ